jgi:hypothetical protein
MNKLRLLSVPATALILVLAACSTTDSGSSSTPTSDAGSVSAEAGTGNPGTEPSGLEQPRPEEKGGAISVASLPIGISSEDQGNGQQCVTVNSLGSPSQPDAVTVSVTGVGIRPTRQATAGGACGGLPACASFTRPTRLPTCSVKVSGVDSQGGQFLSVAANLHCAQGQQQKCTAFKQAIESKPRAQELTPSDSPVSTSSGPTSSKKSTTSPPSSTS